MSDPTASYPYLTPAQVEGVVLALARGQGRFTEAEAAAVLDEMTQAMVTLAAFQAAIDGQADITWDAAKGAAVFAANENPRPAGRKKTTRPRKG